MSHEHDETNAKFGELYRSYRSDLLRYVAGTFGNGPPDPEDAVQAAFEKLATHESGPQMENPRGFLVRCARNFVIDHHRRSRVSETAKSDIAFQETTNFADELDAYRVISGRQRLVILEKTIMEMPESIRDALILHRVEEMSYVEIARHLGISQTTAKRRVAEALKVCASSLRTDKLDDWHNDND